MDLFLVSLLFLLAVTAIMVTISKHIGLGSILGLLIAGIIVGPNTPGPYITSEVESMRHSTEIGVVFLLFVIGLEMQPSKLWSMRKEVFGLGSLQVLFSGVAIGLYMSFYVEHLSLALLLGFTLALSSTAFVMQMLQERGEINTEHGKNAFAILLLQDLAIVPMLACLPLLATHAGTLEQKLWYEQLGSMILMLALLALFGRYILPKALDKVAKQRNKDAFLMFALLSVFLSAYLMEHAGLSMALGAFLMGMMLSTSRYAYQIESSIEPFKGILMSLFFIAVGMSIDFKTIFEMPGRFAEHIAVILMLKAIILFILMLSFGASRSNATKVAFLLNQSGEFGFVLFGAAKALGLINDQLFVVGIGVISISMLLTPALYHFGCMVAEIFSKHSEVKHLLFKETQATQKVLIAGYGSTGKVIAQMLRQCEIPFIVFDNNPSIVHIGRKEGIPLFYGDITDMKLLETTKIEHVSMFIVSIDKSLNAKRVIEHVKQTYPHVKIIARAVDINAMDKLLDAGANWVLAETVESSLRIGEEALRIMGVESEDIVSLIELLRKNDYDAIRDMTRIH